MGGCTSKSSTSPADKKASTPQALSAKKGSTSAAPPAAAAARKASKDSKDPNALTFVPAKEDKHTAHATGEKPPVELSVVAPKPDGVDLAPPPLFTRPPSDAPTAPADGARATSTARVEEVVVQNAKSSAAAGLSEDGAAIRRMPPPAPTADNDDSHRPPAETPAARKTEWELVRARLPRQKTPADKARRLALFEQFDKDKSGALNYEEVHKGCVDILHLDHFTPHLHDITRRAFNEARVLGTEDRNAGEDDKVEFLEFRLMLCYIYDYFELTVMFDEIDKDGSMMIDKDEFVAKAAPMLTSWGVPVMDAEATFTAIDTNESGILTFEEFATWATDQKSEVMGDPDAGVETVAAPAPIEAPKVEEAKVEEPKVEEPKVEEPKVEEPKVEEPKVEEAAKASLSSDAPVARSVAVPVPVPTSSAAAAADDATPHRAAPEELSASARKTEWERVRALLPCEKNAEDKQRRIDLFEEFDKDKSGALTCDEVYRGCVNVLHLNRFTSRLKDITKRAFNKAKDMGNKDRGAGEEDKVEFLEFRLMLCYIHDYFELTVMFDEIDKDGSMMIDKDEFVAKAAPMLEKWGVSVDNPEATFSVIDGNNSGAVTFDEFATWAAARKVDAGGDPDAADAAVPSQEEEEEEAADPIVFTDGSDAEAAGGDENKDEVQPVDLSKSKDGEEEEAEDEEEEEPAGSLDPRRVYGFDGDSTGLGAGAKEEGAMPLDDEEEEEGNNNHNHNNADAEDNKPADSSDDEVKQMSDEESLGEKATAATPPPPPPPKEEEEVKPVVPVVVHATKEHEYEMGQDDINDDDEVEAPRAVSLEAAEQPVEVAARAPAAATHVDPMADVAEQPIVPIVVRAAKEHEYEMGQDDINDDDEVEAPRAVSLEATEQPVPAPTPAEAIQQNIIDDLFADEPVVVRAEPPAPRRLPPPMPSPGERAERPDDDEPHAVDVPAVADAANEEAEVATPPPARRAPPPMFSPPPPDADSDAENSVSNDVDAFYGRGAEGEAPAAAAAPEAGKKSGEDDSGDEL